MSPVSASVGVVGACAYDCDCGCVNVSGSVCDVCAWVWLCTVAVAVVAAAAADDEDEDEACARCSRHGPLPLDRSSMISSSPSSTTHHPPADGSKPLVLAISGRPSAANDSPGPVGRRDAT